MGSIWDAKPLARLSFIRGGEFLGEGHWVVLFTERDILGHQRDHRKEQGFYCGNIELVVLVGCAAFR